ncbi:dynamin family protein [Bacillus sp. JJ1474]|uniref:dynamin family protein n=1 Tax=Bacillus sp. JJ1474 TaxID=3122955 RepID=UPI002FFEC96C
MQLHEETINMFKNISGKYTQQNDLISDGLQTELQLFVSHFKDKMEGIVQNEKILKIGIVGEVKAGKSSFLNALLFEGKKILPEAPTPMTAALTKISYAAELKAEVFFYSRKDWEMIEELSHQYDLEYQKLKEELISRKREQSENPFSSLSFSKGDKSAKARISEEEIRLYVNERVSEEKKGCKELTNLVVENDIKLEEYLDSAQTIKGVETIGDLTDKLGYFVGAEGVLTPIVKSTNIYLNLPGLKDLEVIDTPGTNDPIVSRGLVTRKYLAQCDAIFLLSYAGQFMKNQDVEFLVNTLPTEGIRKGIIIGSKFDAALLNLEPGGDLVQALRMLQGKLTNYANQVINEELKKNPGNITLRSLQEYLPPQFISSLAYSIAQKKGKDLNELESHILHRLKVTFPNREFTPELFSQLANIERIKKKEFKTIVSQKDEILKHKLMDTITGQSNKFRQLIESIHAEAASRLDNLSNFDKKQLQEKFDELMSKLNGSKSNVQYIFENEKIEIEKKILHLQQELAEAQNSYNKVDVSYERKQEYSHSSGWWLWKKDVYSNVTYHYANVNQVIDNVRNYIVSIQRGVIDSFNEIVDSRALRNDLKKAILGLFDLKDSKFNENEILNPIEILMRSLTIPQIKLDYTKYEKMISDTFAASVVQNDQIHKLVKKQEEVMGAVIKDIQALLEQEKLAIKGVLTKEGQEFTGKIAKSIGDTLVELQQQLESREMYIQAYKELLADVEQELAVLKIDFTANAEAAAGVE